MRYQFETEDNATFVLDMVQMKWGRVSTILAAPSVKAVEHEAFTYNLLEEGDLIPMGGGVYTMQGRTAKTGLEDPKNPKPGAGLCAVGVLAIPYEDTLQLYLRANVMLKEDSFKSMEVKKIKYHIIQASQPVPSAIVQPPPQTPSLDDVAQKSE